MQRRNLHHNMRRLGACRGWYDFGDYSTLIDPSAYVCTPGTAVDVVLDKSGLNKHARQPSSTKRPIARHSVRNGLSAVEMDGSNDFLGLPDSRDVTNGVSGFTVVAAVYNGLGSNCGVFHFPCGNSSGTDRFLGYIEGEAWGMGATRADGAGATYRNGSGTSANTWYVGIWVQDYANALSRVRVNGTEAIASGTCSTSGTVSATNSAGDPVLGNLYGGTLYPWIGYLGEIVFYAEAFSDAKIAIAETMMRRKWGVPAL